MILCQFSAMSCLIYIYILEIADHVNARVNALSIVSVQSSEANIDVNLVCFINKVIFQK